MKRPKKIAVYILIAIGVLALALVLLNNFLEGRIKQTLEDKLTRARTTYEKVDVKLLDRKAEVIQASVKLGNKSFKVDTLLLNDIGIWEYITNKNIQVGELFISNPEVAIYESQKQQKDSAKAENPKKLKEQILIKKVRVKGGTFQISETDTSEHRLFAKLNELQMNQVRLDSASLKQAVPFEYDLQLLQVDSLFYEMDEQHYLSFGNLQMKDQDLTISDLQIIPKYSKSRHQETIEVEKDRYDLQIDSISVNNFNWSLQNDSLKIQNSLLSIHQADLYIYRDKIPPDDNSFKPLYSRAIRNLPALIEIDSVSISDSYLKYEERIQPGRTTGMVEFSNLNGSISNITNNGLNRDDFPKTRVQASADFMRGAPLSIDWQFDISDQSDAFHLSGQMGHLNASQMNRFMKASMNVEVTGDILDMYFNFYGNNNQATGDMRLEYKDFKVEVLRKDGQQKNKIISALANLIVRNKAVKGEKQYKEIKVQRDKSKSFWNFFWLMVKNGAFKSFI
ncbi:hypothetical protein E0K83_02110 [Gramella sp. BOM4]|nr:hypothetical protein [Christiangramia bathymodioli]